MPDRTATIGALIGLDFSLIPVLPRDKRPAIAWKKYQETHATHEELEQWFGNGHDHNIGIATGPISGIIVVDTDTVEGEQWVREHLPDTPLKVRTAKGVHRYFRHNGLRVRNKARIRDGVDLRADGGYVLGPSSVHPSGVTYEPIGELPATIDQLPVFDPKWIPSKAKPESRQGQRSRSRREIKDQRRLIERARAYVSKVPPAIEGQGGDQDTFTLVCRLVRGFDLTDDEAMDVLVDWNQSCQPPWSERELEAKIQNARRYGDEPIGGRLGGDVGVDDDAEHASDQSEQTQRPFPLTDLGNAECFTDQHGDQVRYDHRRDRWLVWDSPIWSPDADAEIFRRATDCIRRRYHDADEVDDLKAREAVAKWAVRSESRDRLKALVELAQSRRPIADAGDGWDPDPMLIACQNGAVDLRDGSIRKGRPTDRLTMQAAVVYRPDATCPRWVEFLDEIFGGNAELIDYLQKVLGYTCTGDTSEQAWWMAYGTGSNGKTTLIRTVHAVLGTYARNTPFTTFLHNYRGSGISNDLAALAGPRFVWASEVNENAKLNEGRIKSLTGDEAVTARFLNREFFTFEPQLKLFMAVNHRPEVNDHSYAMWRRVRVIPFERQFPVNKTLEADLMAEAEGIFAWMIRGTLQWLAEGLDDPDSVRVATDDYKEDSNKLVPFLEAACTVEKNAQTGAQEFYRHYTRWADSLGLTRSDRLSQTMFGRKASERFEKKHTATGTVYFGVTKRDLMTGLP